MKRFQHIQFAARTDVGRKRKNNEDALGAFPSAGIFCVADGMGGGDDGEIASAAVVKAVEDISKVCIPQGETGGYAVADVADVLEKGLNRASSWILKRASEKKLSGCGATFVGVILDATHPASALAVHAGDSRLYLLHGRSIKQVTRDHSAAEMLGARDERKLNPAFRSMVMNAVGIRPNVDVEQTPFKVAAGDRILICSDGLSRMVPDKKILAISRELPDVGDAVEALISAALEAGGVDNVTVVLVEIGPLPPPQPPLAAPDFDIGSFSGEVSAEKPEDDDCVTTDGAMPTLQTLQPSVVMEKSQQVAPPTAQSKPAKAKSGKRRIALWGVALGMLFAVIIAGLVRKRGAGRIHEADHETKAVPVHARPPRPAEKPAPRQESAPAVEAATNAAGGGSARIQADPKTGESQDKAPLPPTNGVEVAAGAVFEKVKESNDATPPVPVANADGVCTNLVIACDAQNVASFTSAVRGLFPSGKASFDCQEQIRRFEANAKVCARMRTAKAAEAVAVDVKIMLQTAGEAKAALGARAKVDVVRRWLSDWEVVLSGDSKSRGVQEACARLILGAPEVSAE